MIINAHGVGMQLEHVKYDIVHILEYASHNWPRI